MTQKVLKIGSSAGVTIPKKSLAELGLSVGDAVEVRVDEARKTVSIRAAQRKQKDDDARIARLTLRFIDRYRKDLENLAQK